MTREDGRAVWSSPLLGELAEELLRLTRCRPNAHPDSILDNSAFMIIWMLSDGRPRTLRELTEELDLEQSTVNRQVNAAIKHGYLERFEVEGSLSRLIRPTTKGREAFRHDGLLRADRLERVVGDLAPGTLDALVGELRAYNDAHDRILRHQERPARIVR